MASGNHAHLPAQVSEMAGQVHDDRCFTGAAHHHIAHHQDR